MFELGEADVRRLVGVERDSSRTLSSDAQALLGVIQKHAPSDGPRLNIARAAALAGIGSKRKLLTLLNELEQAGLIRTKRLMERGQPRVIELPHHLGAGPAV